MHNYRSSTVIIGSSPADSWAVEAGRYQPIAARNGGSGVPHVSRFGGAE